MRSGGQSSYLDQADQSYRRAREIRHSFDASIHPLNREAAVLCDRFKLTRQQSDLNKAIELHRQALPLLSKQPRQLSLASFDFADTLLTLFNETGLTIHLDEAIGLYEQALELNPAPRFPRAKCLNGLGVALRKRFEISGKDEVISKSIGLHEEALKLCPEPYIERDDCFSGLASALARRYMKFGEQSDLKAALNSYLSALDLLSSSHPKRATLLFGLATTIRIFLENAKQEEKLEGVIPYYREALELLPLTHVDRADSLFGLAVALKTLHVQRSLNPHKFHTVANKSETILDDILPLYSEPNSSGIMSKNWLDYLPIPNIFGSTNLKAPSMSSRASQPNMRERAQIDSPREKPRRSSHPSHGDSPTRLLSMANIHAPKHRLSASSLQSDAVSAISMTHGQYEELDEAINLLKESLQLRPPTHPARIESLRCIVDAYTIRFGAVGHPDVDSYRRELNALEYGFKHPTPSEAI
ncbi:hypothetical protein JR316_0002742 [Psilocybe cubensis]|uniref:Uncharacterized protein n=2 Tax=Psilocybe cubensis TaxID=181762 RepID=A0ACB8HDU9_PSICU|nr:hypothetical protein JR316_0002742 [Psilocybe cubensis]KAH9485827.1 hypothetical protein JR316_0002742 [Psilocybe cubensis]